MKTIKWSCLHYIVIMTQSLILMEKRISHGKSVVIWRQFPSKCSLPFLPGWDLSFEMVPRIKLEESKQEEGHHACNPSTQQAKAGEFQASLAAEWDPKILYEKPKQANTKKQLECTELWIWSPAMPKTAQQPSPVSPSQPWEGKAGGSEVHGQP